MKNQREDNFLKFKTGIQQGLEKGGKGLVWILKIIIPISFATNLLVHFGLIHKLDFILAPVMHFLGLPASAALVLIMGFFTGIYGTVAALSVMPFAMEHMILIAVFNLIAHNIIQESIVQGKSGINAFMAGGFRLFMAFFVTYICALVLGITPEIGGPEVSPSAVLPQVQSFGDMLSTWAVSTLKLSFQIFCIIMVLMVVLETAKMFNVISKLTTLLSPVLKFMGLSPSTGMLWLTASVFGLAYGAAVIVEETQAVQYPRHDLYKLHLSIGVNHAMIEDPALFLPLGLPVFWLWVPRLLAAVAAVWIYTFFISARRLHAERSGHKKFCNHR